MSARNRPATKAARRDERQRHKAALDAIRDPYRFVVGWCSLVLGRGVTRPNRVTRRRNVVHGRTVIR